MGGEIDRRLAYLGHVHGAVVVEHPVRVVGDLPGWPSGSMKTAE